ncbi:MAG: peptidoglycan-binding protein [Bacilli bacterium]|nr:peptidoglycan-binding protein [Bacilli bacterium]
MLSVKQRQTKLKDLGYYKGKIDGKVGTLTKKAYKNLQKDYYTRKKDVDGVYGKNTDILLNSVWNVWAFGKNFDVKGDKLYCRCNGKYCNGFPATINENLIKNLQKEREKFGATSVTSMLRCKKWNKIQGGVSGSLHTKGRAVDFRTPISGTLDGRKEMINYWFTLTKPNYGYCNGFYRKGKKTGTKKAPNMGISTHCDVK